MNQAFISNVLAISGDRGQKWLDKLPSLVHFYEEKWRLKCSGSFPLSYNYVVPAETYSGQPVVLKISFPGNPEFSTEVKALNIYQGRGSIRIIQEDEANDVVLLERALPGTRIGDVYPDKKQIALVCEVIRQLKQAVSKDTSHFFPSLMDWAKAFERYRRKFDIKSGPIPSKMFEEAEEVFAQSRTNAESNILLHGDLHNDNMLLSDRGWLAIDPKGVVGVVEYDIGTYLRNPYSDLPKNSNHDEVMKKRVLQFSEELNLDKQKILRWTLANAVLSLLWFLEDQKMFNTLYLRNAELISEIRF